MVFVKQVLLPAATLALVFLLPAIPSRAVARDGCLTCHQGLGDKPSALFAHDIHARHAVTCAGCHGGDASTDDMEQAMNKTAGFIG